MRRLVYLKDAVVVHLEDVDDLNSDFDKGKAFEFDTIIDDPSKTYTVNDEYTVDNFFSRNPMGVGHSEQNIQHSYLSATKYINSYLSYSSMLRLPALLSVGSLVATATLSWVDSVMAKYDAEVAAYELDPEYNISDNFNSCGDCPHTDAEIVAAYSAL